MAETLTERYGGKVQRTFRHALKGFSAQMTESQAKQIAKDASVKYVQQDSFSVSTGFEIEPTWGLDRIDQQALPFSRTYTYDSQGGEGVHIYVVDTGVRTTHVEFAGRIGNGANFVADGHDTVEDCHGHGTHVAAIAAGSTYGVAKKATIHPIRAQDCKGGGPDSMVLEAVDWIFANQIAPAVVNLSLKTEALPALEEAIRASIAHGITYVIAASNERKDACTSVPARVNEAITVGASASYDAVATFSNFGPCIDLFAPGDGIRSAWKSSDTATEVLGGTSMAAPHVAGAAALYLGKNGSAAPAAVAKYLVDNATVGVLGGIEAGTPNRLLYIPPPSGPACNATATPSPKTGAIEFGWGSETANLCTWELDGVYKGVVACSGSGRVIPQTAGNHTVRMRTFNDVGSGSCEATYSVPSVCSVAVSAGLDGTYSVEWNNTKSKSCTWSLDGVSQGNVACAGLASLGPQEEGRHTVVLQSLEATCEATYTAARACEVFVAPISTAAGAGYSVTWNSVASTSCTWAMDGVDQGPVPCTGSSVLGAQPVGDHTITLVSAAGACHATYASSGP